MASTPTIPSLHTVWPSLPDRQKQIDALIKSLPQAIRKGEAAIMKWLYDFSQLGDDSALQMDKSGIANALKSAGYERSAGNSPNLSTGNPTELAQWIIGSAIANLEEGLHGEGLCPRPSTIAIGYGAYQRLMDAQTSGEVKTWSSELGARIKSLANRASEIAGGRSRSDSQKR